MKSKTVINFGPGPAKLPEEVMMRAQKELLEHGNTGISILETSHRSQEFKHLVYETEQHLRDLMNIPSSYKVLFLQGGGTGQFAAVPLNLRYLSKGQMPSADYVVSGGWSGKAAKEAEKYLTVQPCIDPPLTEYVRIPSQASWKHSPDASYLYYCANETIHGVEFDHVPESRVPIVADISSNILSKPMEVWKHGVMFAGTQKNLGAAGLTIVIVRDDLLDHACKSCPSILEYHAQANADSIYNTPPVYSIYITNLVLEWIRDIGGVDEIARRNALKAKTIYDIIDDSKGFYHCPVELDCRSRMNIPFHIGCGEGEPSLEKMFVTETEKLGMLSLKGHRSVGGIRASLYNAIDPEEVDQLAEFMKEFYELHGAKEP